jgi:hypothetical protein
VHHYGIVERDGGWAYRPENAIFGDFCDENHLQKQPLITVQLSKSCRGNPKASSLKTAVGDGIPSILQTIDRPGTDVA